MKSTYEIPGLFWDGIPISSQIPEELSVGEFPQLARVPRNLFDAVSFKRTFLLSDLLKAPSKSWIESSIASLVDCDEVIIAIDYRPRASGSIPQRFYEKRLAQAISYVRELLPDVKISVADWRIAT